MPEPVRGANSPRLAILVNIVAPYHKPLFDRLAHLYPTMRVFVSTPMERNRAWNLEWAGLDVVVQKTITLNRRWRHPKGFSEPLYVHLPADTIPQLLRFHAEIVISWEMGVRTMLAAIYRRLHGRSRLIVWAEFAESTDYGRGNMRQQIRKLLHHAIDAFLVTGESGARYLEALGIPARKIHKIVYTTDLDRFAAVPCTRPPKAVSRLLFVGQLIERKGLLPFLDVLSGWARTHPDRVLEFHLAGSGPLRTQLEQYAPPANVLLTFLGDVSYSELPAVYAEADIFVFPTMADTWGVVVNEAMAAGVPVLGSIYGQAVSELVSDGVNGWTFRPDHSAEMLQALEQALATPRNQLEEMRTAARVAALRFTPDYVTGLIDNAILSCFRDLRASTA